MNVSIVVTPGPQRISLVITASDQDSVVLVETGSVLDTESGNPIDLEE